MPAITTFGSLKQPDPEPEPEPTPEPTPEPEAPAKPKAKRAKKKAEPKVKAEAKSRTVQGLPRFRLRRLRPPALEGAHRCQSRQTPTSSW